MGFYQSVCSVTRVCIVKRGCSIKIYDKKRKLGPSIVAARGLEA